jgi:hypothetical protein
VVAFSYSDYERDSKVDASAAGTGGGESDGSVVQPCELVSDCPAPGAACKLADCIDQLCVVKNSPDDDLPPASQQPGDCKKKACQGGVVIELDDDQDLENDNNPCTDDVCQSGTPLHPPLADNTPCGSSVCMGGFCGCTTIGECGAPTACAGWKCEANKCVPDLIPAGNPPLTAGCSAAPPCGFDGTCDGSGSCRFAAAASPCGYTCSGSQATGNVCDGSGACITGTTTQPCGIYACTPLGGCLSSCTSPNECAAGYTCNTSNQCVNCTSCFDWLDGEANAPECPNGGCNQWSNLINCCGICPLECGGAGDLCSGTTSQCYSSGPPSATCKACLVANGCGSYLSICETDDGH